jgi:enoyl-CoA hydratase/carnithine racemase
MSDTILVDDRDGILTLTLNRPDSLNAINRELGNTLLDRLDDAEMDDRVRVVVLKGSGRAFCAGDDIRGGSAPPPEWQRADALSHARKVPYYNLVQKIRNIPKPVIIQAHGYALGAGCDLVLASDFCVGAESCQFGLVFVKRAIIGGTFFITKHVGLKQASRLLLTGDMVSAREAAELGMITEWAPDDQLEVKVQEWADRFAKAPTRTIGYLKNGINFGLTHDMARSIEFQAYQQNFATQTQDRVEGRAAFRERRDPEFIGR